MQRELPRLPQLEGHLVRHACELSESSWASLRDTLEKSDKRFCVAEGSYYSGTLQLFDTLVEAEEYATNLERKNGTRIGVFVIAHQLPITCIHGEEVDDGIPF